MADKFDLTSLLNDASAAAVTEQSKTMRVTMIPIDKLDKNPANSIYVIGDVTLLAEDIRANGVRQPLEVIAQPGGRYMLISGHRRLAACQQINAGSFGMECKELPCVIRASEGEAGDEINLITANATARELTDGERLDQYQALKAALVQLKKEGKVQGRVRDEMARRLGESTGALGRLNALAANATEEVKDMLRKGEISMSRAYETSKVHPRQQAYFAKNGSIPSTPKLTKDQRAVVTKWILEESSAVEAMRKQNYRRDEWSFMHGTHRGCNGIIEVPMEDGSKGLASIFGDPCGSYVKVTVTDPADEDYVTNQDYIYWRELYDRAKTRYWDKADQALFKADKEQAEEELQARRDFREQTREKVMALETWPKATKLPAGLVLYQLPLTDGSSLLALADGAETDAHNRHMLMYRRMDTNGNPMQFAPDYQYTNWTNYLPGVAYDAIGAVLEFDPEEMNV